MILTVTCPAGTYVTNYGYVAMFDSGVIYSTANSTDTKCPDYTVNRKSFSSTDSSCFCICLLVKDWPRKLSYIYVY